MTKSSRDGSTIVQESSLGICGYSLEKSGQNYFISNHTSPVDAEGSNGEKYTGDLCGKTSIELAMSRRPRDLMDPASVNPEQLTSTPTKQDLVNEEIQKLAMKTHVEVQQREDIRRDLSKRMKFVPPDLRMGESVFY